MELPGANHNIGGYFEVDKIKFWKLKQEIFNKGIKHIPKMSTVRLKKFGFYFWKQIDQEIAKGQIKKCESIIKNDQD